MNKGWKVKVETNVVFTVGTEMCVVAPDKVKAGIRAQELIERYLDGYKNELWNALPLGLDMGGLHWSRGPWSGEIDFDSMQSVLVEPDPDFDPEEDEVPEEAVKVHVLMEVAQCLNEAYYSTADDHPLREWQEQHGIAEVRDQINLCAIYCEGTYRIVKDEIGFLGSFDLDFVPTFLENCVDHKTFMPRSENLNALAIHWQLG